MEFNPSVLSTIPTNTYFYVIVLAFLLYIFNRKRAKRGNNRQTPQAKGAWPIIGHLHLLGGSELTHKILGDMADKHGPIFTIKLGVHQVLVVSNGDMAKDCFTTSDKAFASRPKSAAAELMSYDYAMFGLAPYGDYWRKMRKIIMLEVLSQQRVELLGHVRVSELRASIKDIYEAWENNKKCEHLDMVKVDMSQWFGNFVLNILVRINTGKRFSHNDEEGVRFQMVVKKHFELLGAFVASDFIPYLKWMDVGGYKKAMKQTGKELDIFFDEWLKERRIELGSAQKLEGNQVFIDVLINILQGASEDEFPGLDHDTIIKSTCEQMLTAGLDTTTLTLTWALSLLLNNPKALEIAKHEIDEHVGKDRPVAESDLKNLVYLDSIIKETLRLYPPAPLSVPHESIEDCIVGGYNIPKGTRLLVNLRKLHRDPKVWSDPNEFQPERFLNDKKDIDIKGKHFELLPFGSGRRMCPAVSFALPGMRLTLASLIQQFTLKKPSNEPIDMSESPGLTSTKATSLEVLLAPRLSYD
ncbi:demethylepipodophyllotoxin synthase-like [Bidens hawaiensis]|uniref:demethylepipodophyllotoxin synthase-like n=1 Tax=Bidens hawaiensis TaxID=980011 RepID=UPI00404AEFFA